MYSIRRKMPRRIPFSGPSELARTPDYTGTRRTASHSGNCGILCRSFGCPYSPRVGRDSYERTSRLHPRGGVHVIRTGNWALRVTGFVAVATPAFAQPTAGGTGGKGTPVRAVCDGPAHKGEMSCHALVRTDVAS